MGGREKTQEERIEDAAKAMIELSGGGWDKASNDSKSYWCRRARVALEAADAPVVETPAWPTDESVEAYRNACGWSGTPGKPVFESSRSYLRSAFEVDPIIKAAVEAVGHWGEFGENMALSRRERALRDAGLLDTETSS